jgi:hypothetical protein
MGLFKNNDDAGVGCQRGSLMDPVTSLMIYFPWRLSLCKIREQSLGNRNFLLIGGSMLRAFVVVTSPPVLSFHVSSINVFSSAQMYTDKNTN